MKKTKVEKQSSKTIPEPVMETVDQNKLLLDFSHPGWMNYLTNNNLTTISQTLNGILEELQKLNVYLTNEEGSEESEEAEDVD